MDGDEDLSIDVETIDDGTDNVIGTESRDLNCVRCGFDVGSHAVYIIIYYILSWIHITFSVHIIIYYILYIIIATYILAQYIEPVLRWFCNYTYCINFRLIFV